MNDALSCGHLPMAGATGSNTKADNDCLNLLMAMAMAMFSFFIFYICILVFYLFCYFDPNTVSQTYVFLYFCNRSKTKADNDGAILLMTVHFYSVFVCVYLYRRSRWL